MRCNFVLANQNQCKLYTNKLDGYCHLHSHKQWRFLKPSTCPVCFCSIHQARRPLECQHWVHRSCVIKSGKAECPLCRQALNDICINNHFDLDEIIDDFLQEMDFEEIEIPQELIVFAIVAYQLYQSLVEPISPVLDQSHFISGVIGDILPQTHPSHQDVINLLQREALNIMNSITS